ncbi:hypothetical protein G9A89_008786 [Geosiphon pyriformis]|nr:hypothetical protein G9A89_008786 [Geosiphon pyriformis]
MTSNVFQEISKLFVNQQESSLIDPNELDFALKVAVDPFKNGKDIDWNIIANDYFNGEWSSEELKQRWSHQTLLGETEKCYSRSGVATSSINIGNYDNDDDDDDDDDDEKNFKFAIQVAVHNFTCASSKREIDWDLMSKEYFNCNYSANILKQKWNEIQQRQHSDLDKSPMEESNSSDEIISLTEEQELFLKAAVQLCGTNAWERIVKEFFVGTNLTPKQLEYKWKEIHPREIQQQQQMREITQRSILQQKTEDILQREIFKLQEIQTKSNSLMAARPTRNYPNHKWAQKDNDKLKRLTDEFGRKWKKIARILGLTTAAAIKDHYYRYIHRSHVSLDRFDLEEKKKLAQVISEYGADNWEEIMKHFPNRSKPQLRTLIWRSSLVSPGKKIHKWSPEEINLVITAHKTYGDVWKKVSQVVGTRTPLQCMNWIRRNPKKLKE